MKKQDIQVQPDRIIVRSLARELFKDQLARISGGHHSSSRWSSSDPQGEGDDGGADD